MSSSSSKTAEIAAEFMGNQGKEQMDALPDETFAKVRQTFLEKHGNNLAAGANKYHELDVKRINDNYDWIKAFYFVNDEDLTKTVEMIDDTLTWRKNFNCNDLVKAEGEEQTAFPKEFYNLGSMYFRKKDINGYPIMYFIARTRGKEDRAQVMKFITHFFEKIYTFSLNDPIVLMFDMTGSGLAHVDLETTKFIVNLLKFYYPGFVRYMIVYDLPFVYQAVWKIVKGILPAKAVQLVQFANKSSIKRFVSEDSLMTHMGGKDTYTYSNSAEIFGEKVNEKSN